MSGVSRYLVDTNILLRFLSGEPPGQARATQKLFSRAYSGELLLDISPVIVAETYYTLTSFYGVERKVAAEKLSVLLQQRGVKLREAAQVLATLDRLQTVNIGFADAYLAAGAAEEKVSVVSFDRDFDKLADIVRYDPAT
jgi:predicted nucleic acid-binding protein